MDECCRPFPWHKRDHCKYSKVCPFQLDWVEYHSWRKIGCSSYAHNFVYYSLGPKENGATFPPYCCHIQTPCSRRKCGVRLRKPEVLTFNYAIRWGEFQVLFWQQNLCAILFLMPTCLAHICRENVNLDRFWNSVFSNFLFHTRLQLSVVIKTPDSQSGSRVRFPGQPTKRR